MQDMQPSRRLLLGAAPALASAAPLARLEANLQRITRSVAADWGIHVECLETGEKIELDAGRRMDTMSTIKIPLMAECFRQIAAGRFSLSDRHVLAESEKRPGTGVLRSLDAGASVTIKDLLMLMTIVSDNTATDLLFAKTGGVQATNAFMKQLGLATIEAPWPCEKWFADLRAAKSPEEFHRAGKTPYGWSSPRDMGRLLAMIKKGELVSAEACAQMLDMLRRQVYSSRLPKYVTGFRVPHKTGDFLPYIANDVGVFESEKRNVVMCVFTAHHYGVGPQLEDAIARIGELVANHFAA